MERLKHEAVKRWQKINHQEDLKLTKYRSLCVHVSLDMYREFTKKCGKQNRSKIMRSMIEEYLEKVR